ncbi:MAG TPA: succinate dehydrogenase, cytochrome b556 subunit [Xanthomonadaceae bacterium]|nr:succinate dehydrogenase, cytochrome b556 subunit [Xanthomonadaceae bacterium]
MATPERPLSPFTDIYRWQITMTLSILHRITGVVLALGAFGVVWWLLAVSASDQRYAQFSELAQSLPGRIVLGGFSYCLMYHLLNGLRHLLWDSGRGFEIKQFYATGWTVVVLSFVLTGGIWMLALQHGAAA